MIVPIAFTIAVVVSCLYAALYGGRTGRWGGGILLSTWPMSWALSKLMPSYGKAIPVLFLVDLMVFIGLLVIALLSTRRWPIWCAAFQLNTVAAHLAIMLSPVVLGQAYYAMISIWGVPMLFVMVVGTLLDRRAELRRA
ncbi:hypothetical protein [Sphingobium phenoxybenzoativorans]|uniref:hypothetical protein n=1 Tax=Sphingobium phenoxybenzoativorans TaxID=1592790 RepID=UPI0008727307|nr:hypothetical protein [Sphingobium phenoxybenzoativorans]